MTDTMTEELKAWTFEARPSEDGLCWEIWDTTDHNGGRIGVIDGKGACDDFHAQYAKVCADALTARRFGLSRTPTEAEPGEAEVERRYAVSWLRKVARARDDRADPEWAEALSEAADFIERGEHLVHSDLPALRSTTPASEPEREENYLTRSMAEIAAEIAPASEGER